MKAVKHSTPTAEVRLVPNVAGILVPHCYCPACDTIVRAEINGAGYSCPNRRPKFAYGTYSKKSFCECCGFKPKFGSTSLKVHHTTGTKEIEDNDKLVTVCGNCHDELEDLVTKLSQAFNEFLPFFQDYQNKGFFSKDFFSTSTKLNKPTK